MGILEKREYEFTNLKQDICGFVKLQLAIGIDW